MQNTIVMAFRKRLKKRGYINISIYFNRDTNTYHVMAIEPLGGVKISSYYSLERMHYSFKF